MDLSDRVGTLVQTMETESDAFQKAVREDQRDSSELQIAMRASKTAVRNLPMDYGEVDDSSYALIHSIKSAYEVYADRRDQFLLMNENQEGYLDALYEIYDMQEYLNSYSTELMIATSKAGNGIYQNILPQMIAVPLIMMILSIIMIVGTIELTRAMNRSMIGPIIKLSDASQKLAKDKYLNKNIHADTQDELADLVHAFNEMSDSTAKYIVALEEKRETLEMLHAEEMQKIAIENQLEQTKFEALKNQMNPHFLFNTLNVIGGMAKLEDADLTEKMIKSLSNLFRYNIRTSETEIALDQDIKVVEDYLYLQKMRFGERIKWEISYEPELGSYLVPTFMFQPFVENAIVHGISPKIEGGKIYISVTKEDERLHIEIRDNGVGMNQETLYNLRNRLSDAGEIHRGIGVGNIYRRLSLMYDESDFRIESEENVGTTITIIIPAREYIA